MTFSNCLFCSLQDHFVPWCQDCFPTQLYAQLIASHRPKIYSFLFWDGYTTGLSVWSTIMKSSATSGAYSTAYSSIAEGTQPTGHTEPARRNSHPISGLVENSSLERFHNVRAQDNGRPVPLSLLAGKSAPIYPPDMERVASTLPPTLPLAASDVNKSASEACAETRNLELRCSGITDPWFKKHGVKGFLSSELLAEDVPADLFILGSPIQTALQLSPRSEARSLTRVCQLATGRYLANPLQVRELLQNPPKNASTSTHSQVGMNDRVSIFGTRRAPRSRLNGLAQNKVLDRQASKDVTAKDTRINVQEKERETHLQAGREEDVRGAMESDEQEDGAVLESSNGNSQLPTSGRDQSNNARRPAQKVDTVSPHFVIQKEKRPLLIRKPEDRGSVRLTGAAQTSGPVAAAPDADIELSRPAAGRNLNQAAWPLTSAATATPLHQKPRQGPETRFPLSCAASPPLCQNSLKLPIRAGPLPQSAASAAPFQPNHSSSAPYLPSAPLNHQPHPSPQHQPTASPAGFILPTRPSTPAVAGRATRSVQWRATAPVAGHWYSSGSVAGRGWGRGWGRGRGQEGGLMGGTVVVNQGSCPTRGRGRGPGWVRVHSGGRGRTWGPSLRGGGGGGAGGSGRGPIGPWLSDHDPGRQTRS